MSNLEQIITIIETFMADCTLISGVHVKPETGNLLVFFSSELPASDLTKLDEDIKAQSDSHGVSYNPKDYNNKTQKFTDAFITFYEGEQSSLIERQEDALAKLKANFSK